MRSSAEPPRLARLPVDDAAAAFATTGLRPICRKSYEPAEGDVPAGACALVAHARSVLGEPVESFVDAEARLGMSRGYTDGYTAGFDGRPEKVPPTAEDGYRAEYVAGYADGVAARERIQPVPGRPAPGAVA